MFEFKLSEQMTMIIIEALGEYKLRLAGPVVAELQRQVNAQRMPMPPGNGKAEESIQVTPVT